MPRDREQEQIRAVLEAIENETTSLELSVEVDGADITVTMPGTKFSVTYQKREDSPTIVLTHTWLAPSITTPAVSDFRARAFQAAVNKARELGWIV